MVIDNDQILDDLVLGLGLDMNHLKDKTYYGACVGCRDAVYKSEEKCMVADRLFHDKCFVCVGCQSAIGKNPYYMVGNDAHCPKCYKQKNCQVCNVCKKYITDSKIEFSGKVLHASCFKCSSCDKSLDGVQFKVENDNIVCIPCYQDKALPKCIVCTKPIVADKTDFTCVMYEGTRWHNECFKCYQCKTVCNDKFPGHIVNNNKVFCLTHCGCQRCQLPVV